MSAPAQVVQLTCPNCRSAIRAQVFTLIDVGQQPQLKNYLLSGQINLAACQNCGNVSMIAAPLVYHDPAKQLFLVHFPQQINARPEEQERFIGDASSMIMRTLPPDAPKGYLLAPRRFLTMNTLIETVLEADGITKEMIENQRRKVDLISQIAEAYEQDETQLPALAEQHRADLDEEFFTILGAFAQTSAQSGQAESSDMLLRLRDELAALVGITTEGDEEEISLEEALDRLLGASDDELEQTIADLRPAIDYTFFEALTERIEAAQAAGDTAEAERLTGRRAQILETSERLDREAQELFDGAAETLSELLGAEDTLAALRERRDEINDAFLLVLEANMAAAERAGNTAIAGKLNTIRTQAFEVVEESLSPEDRFINQLLAAETPQDATKLLRQNPASITTPFVKRLNEMSDEMAGAGQKDVGDRLRQLAREAGAMLF